MVFTPLNPRTLNISHGNQDHDFWILRDRIDLVEIADDQKIIYFALKSVNCKFFRNPFYRKFDSKGKEFRMKNSFEIF